MNIDEQAANQLIEYLNSSVDFAIAQAPLVAQEIISWTLFMHKAGAALGLSILIAGAIFLYLKWNAWVKTAWSEAALFPMGMMLVGTIVILCNAAVIVKVTLAPRLFLLEFISRLI